jgi:hypothetical protein
MKSASGVSFRLSRVCLYEPYERISTVTENSDPASCYRLSISSHAAAMRLSTLLKRFLVPFGGECRRARVCVQADSRVLRIFIRVVFALERSRCKQLIYRIRVTKQRDATVASEGKKLQSGEKQRLQCPARSQKQHLLPSNNSEYPTIVDLFDDY